MTDITSSNSKQAHDISEISRAIETINESTQQNAALVQQSTAAAKSMTDQAKTLNKLATYFKTK